MPKKRTTDTYTRIYKLRTAGDAGRTIEVSMPRDVIEREARKRGITVGEFIQRFRAIAHFNDFDGVFYVFEPASTLVELPDLGEHTSRK